MHIAISKVFDNSLCLIVFFVKSTYVIYNSAQHSVVLESGKSYSSLENNLMF